MEALEIFLYIDRIEHFSPMNEWQAYMFVFTMYPYIWFLLTWFSFTHIAITPLMLFWVTVAPSTLIDGYRANGEGIPKSNFA